MSKTFVASHKKLLKWYQNNHRKLPWRKAQPEPYEVWISEVMSQQSTMPTIVRYFERWLKKFPTFEAFSKATEAEVLELWAGLGYYSRARNIYKAKEQLKEFIATHKRWPQTQTEWQMLPGVGPYTAGAVASMAFGDSCLPIDGNIIRVLARFYGIKDPINLGADKKLLQKYWEDCASALPKGSHGSVTQAMMELGSQVCKPQGQALCEVCALSEHCFARKEDKTTEYPAPKKRKKTLKIKTLALFYHDPKDRKKLLIRQIPQGKRLSGQWEVPSWELDEQENQVINTLGERFEVKGPVRHAITHHQYEVYRVEAGPWSGALPENHAYWDLEKDRGPGVLSTLTKKLSLI